LKSRALWLKAGNNNTKYFHQFANFRKNTNTISDIKNAKGRTVSSFQEKAEAGASYFENLFQARFRGRPLARFWSKLQIFEFFDLKA
jgi:hypothetical protein